MMISPEGYYEEYLKGKTAAQIMTAIRGLKNEIGHLKIRWSIPITAAHQSCIPMRMFGYGVPACIWRGRKRRLWKQAVHILPHRQS